MLWIKRLALETGILESWWKARAVILVYFWPFMNRNEADTWVWKKYPLLLSAIKKQCGDMVAFTLTYILGMRFGTWAVPYLKALKEGLCLRAGAQSLTNAQWLGHGSETTALLQMPAILFFQTFQQGKQVPHGFFWVSGWQQVIAELILEVLLRLWCFTMREGLTNKSSLH